MFKRGLIFLILITISLSLISPAAAPTNVEKIQEGLEKVAFHAEQYHSGNQKYIEYLANINKAEQEINAALVTSTPQEIKQAIGEQNSETKWVSQEIGSDVELEKPAEEWTNKAIFDGKEYVTYDITPKKVNEEKLQYTINLETEFTQSRPEGIELAKEIDSLKEIAKTVALEPNSLNVNNLAEKSVNIENLFSDYAEQAPEESCSELMSNVLGAETKLSQLEIVTKEYKVFSKGKIEVFATIETCGNCKGQNVENFVNLDLRIKKEGIPVEYTYNKFTPDMFEKMNEVGHKAAVLEAYKAMDELMTAGNYKAAEDMMYRMEAIVESWNDITNSPDEKTRIENFVEKNNFMNSMFQDLPSTTKISEQITFQEVIYKEIKNDTKDEICSNQVDDNDNGKIDCLEISCAGQICGKKEVPIEGKNETTVIELYCIEGICQEKEEKQEQTEPKCGNNICEKNETESCPNDCKKCPEYPPIACQGEVIFKGKDQNGCSIDPTCITKTDSCEKTQDCDQPLCGTSECINGKCQTTNLGECKEKVCAEGNQKIQKCSSGEQIVYEMCTNGLWKTTGFKCSSSLIGVSEELEIQITDKSVCKLSSDCGKTGDVCTNGACKSLALKKETTIATESNSAIGISFTGQAVSIGNVMTGITRDTTKNPNVLETPTDFKQKTSESGSSKSFSITGISRTEGEELAVEVSVNQVEAAQQNKIIEKSGNEKEIYVVTGLCTKNNEEEKAVLSFGGEGEKFQTVSNLKARYEKEEGATEPYCKWKLENLLRERKEIEESLKSVAEYFEKEIPNSADNWEAIKKPILDLHEKNVENQKETAEMMGCLGLKELESYNLINTESNTKYGSFQYEEKTEEIQLKGSPDKVKIITPSIKEFTIFPSETFAKSTLETSMKDHTFPGSIETKTERNVNKGLTNKEIAKIKNDAVLMQKLKSVSEKETDKNLDIHLRFIDENGKVAYSSYVKINGEDPIRIQPLTESEISTKDMVIDVEFSKLYEALSQSEERFNKQNAPWQEESFNPITLTKKVVEYFNTRSKINALKESIKVTPEKSQDEMREIFESIFYKMVEEDKETVQEINTEETVKVWTSSGKTTTIIN